MKNKLDTRILHDLFITKGFKSAKSLSKASGVSASAIKSLFYGDREEANPHLVSTIMKLCDTVGLHAGEVLATCIYDASAEPRSDRNKWYLLRIVTYLNEFDIRHGIEWNQYSRLSDGSDKADFLRNVYHRITSNTLTNKQYGLLKKIFSDCHDHKNRKKIRAKIDELIKKRTTRS